MLWRSSDAVVTSRREPRETFYVLTPAGELVTRLEGHSTSDEDDLWLTVFGVEGGRLIERTTIQHADDAPRLYEEKVHAEGLALVNDAATQRLVGAALARADAEAERERLARERAAAARVDAIAGARADLGAGPLVQRAQEALRERIERWADERAAALLRTLLELTRAQAGAEVLTAFASGCLSACFKSELPRLPTAAAAPARNARLSAVLLEHAEALERDAEGQEWADANRNAAAYRRAAQLIRWAAEQLATT